MKKLTIIIPVYNEEKTIKKLLENVLSVKLPINQIEYIVVDDGSTDASVSIISKFETRHPKLKFIKHKINQGKGAAVRTGLKNATGDYIVIQDADLEYNPKEIALLLQPVLQGEAEVVYGTRLRRLPNFSRDERTLRFFFHYLGNKMLSLLTSFLYSSWLTDMETCYKLFPKDALNGVELVSKGFEFEPEITAKLLKKGYSIKEVPISTNPRTIEQGKKLNTFRDGSKALWTLAKYRFISVKGESIFSDNSFQLTVFFILLLSICLRFINYINRYSLGFDQAHDALLARYAVTHHLLPLLGPFSSAGPFQTGGEWYWLIMFGNILFPYTFLGPWILITILYIVFVLLIILVAKEIGGRKYALIVGLLAALSTAQIMFATSLTNQTPLALLSLLGIWCTVRYIKNQISITIFLLGLCIGVASSIHLSGIALLCLAFSLAIVQRKMNIRHVFLFFLGIFIPWIPVFWVDFHNNFFNTQNMLRYYLHDQYKIPLEALGRRWLTYLGIFWPKQWGEIIGGFSTVGYIEVVSLTAIFIYKKYLRKDIVILLLSTVFMITLLRYTHTPIFDSYLLFMHPFILLLTAWSVFLLIENKRLLGLLLLTIILVGTMYQDFIIIKTSGAEMTLESEETQALQKLYPMNKFTLYTYKDKWKDRDYILSLYLSAHQKTDRKGIKISTIVATRSGEFNYPVLYGSLQGYQLVSLNAFSNETLQRMGWIPVTGEYIYMITEEWFNQTNEKSN